VIDLQQPGERKISPFGRSKFIYADGNALLAQDSRNEAPTRLPIPSSIDQNKSIIFMASDPWHPRVAIGVGPSILIWNYETQKIEFDLQPKVVATNFSCWGAAFGADGKTFAYGRTNYDNLSTGYSRLWDMTNGQLITSSDDNSHGCDLKTSLDGRYGMTKTQRSLTIWDALTGRELETMTLRDDAAAFVAAEFSPDSSKLMVRTAYKQIWSVFVFSLYN
jgi:WD40 repeat protein